MRNPTPQARRKLETTESCGLYAAALVGSDAVTVGANNVALGDFFGNTSN